MCLDQKKNIKKQTNDSLLFLIFYEDIYPLSAPAVIPLT